MAVYIGIMAIPLDFLSEVTHKSGENNMKPKTVVLEGEHNVKR